ncbi:hypothetical protein PHMEG_00027466 [Phytophthora megakarya]|uniref:Retrotransposon gag domain-containing protein n=1 Tax=Phytophthora megakarya TaxID=4795 RepID=A0A225V9T5_9STRA|nr:hypothetical protein PHMEG_00027466 [Phytophthora megakarya]
MERGREMNRFLKEQNFGTVQPPPLGTQDVDMESVGTPDLDSWEYDPDDIGIPSSSGHDSGRDAVATAAIGSGNSSSMIQRVRISAISDLKEFTGKDTDEDRARAWIGKVKSAFQRDQATEEEKCLTFGDLMVGSAKNWHRQLSRTTKTKWADLLESFQIQYCGLGMSVAWQYYHARKRSEETPLDYLYRLNVAALQAKLKIKDENSKARREHVDHYIETLGDPELADRLTLLRLADVDELEKVLCARERAKSSQRRSAFGSKFRQKVPASAPTAPARAAARFKRMIQIPNQRGFQDRTDPTRKETCEGFSSLQQKRKPRSDAIPNESVGGIPDLGPSQPGRQRSPRSRALFPLWVQETHPSGLVEASDM